MSSDENIVTMTPSQDRPVPAPSGGGGGGGDLAQRITRLEVRMDYLATKEDLKDIKIWILGGVIASFVTVGGLALVIWRVFGT